MMERLTKRDTDGQAMMDCARFAAAQKLALSGQSTMVSPLVMTVGVLKSSASAEPT